MKNERQLLKEIIRSNRLSETSNRPPATPDMVMSALRQGKNARSGEPFMIDALEALDNNDEQRAADAIMNALWVDDPWPEDEEALEDMIMAIDMAGDVEQQLADAGSSWLTKFRQGGWRDHSKPFPEKGLSSLYTRARKNPHSGKVISTESKFQLRQIIQEKLARMSESSQFAETAAEEAAKVNRDLGETSGAPGSYSEDQAYWEKYGIVTGEDLAIDLVAGTYSDMYKAVHGIRPRHGFNSYEEVRVALEDLERYAEDKASEDEFYAQQEAEYNKAREELAALMPSALESQYDKMPPRSGMGRRHEGLSLVDVLFEMPVTKGRGWGMDKYEENYPHLADFAHEIDTVFEDAGIFNANVKKFYSGYSGISIEFTDAMGAKQKWMVVDQQGKVGLEDQSMGYIFFGPGGKGIQESNAWIWEQVPYLGRRFGDTEMRDDVRRQTYDAILDTMDSMLEGDDGHLGEAVLREELTQAVTDDDFVQALRRTWDAVAIDVGIRNPTSEDKADEAMAMLGTYEPKLADQFNALPFKDQDMLLRLAFDDQNFYGKMY